MSYTYWPTAPLGHCPGCRCFANIWPSITTTTPYVPRHRKPGPAH